MEGGGLLKPNPPEAQVGQGASSAELPRMRVVEGVADG